LTVSSEKKRISSKARGEKPLLAVSLGDPAGIGPEIVVRAAASSRVRSLCRLVIFGDAWLLDRASRSCGIDVRRTAIVEVRQIGRPYSGKAWPKPGRAAGDAGFRYLDAAARSVLAGEHEALVTAPINKLWLNRAGHDYDGHTGYLSALTGKPATMMLAGRKLRVVLVTTHVAIAEVPRVLDTASIVRCGMTVRDHLHRYHGIRSPRLAVAALNPHAGEGGLFGDEEARIITPAVRQLVRRRVRATGPLPADTLFAAVVAGDYDAVLCMYHDQALIPLKLIEFGRSVNVSMGLPIIRTSPDHGTAYTLAGTGRARPDSMAEAIVLAANMAAVAREAR
jgi:4-hydroxythreonine-4-phosphate dehydrogenase